MSDAAYKQLAVTIQQNLSKVNEPVRKEVKGQFGKIIADYNKKVELIRMKDQGNSSQKTMEFLLVETDWFTCLGLGWLNYSDLAT